MIGLAALGINDGAVAVKLKAVNRLDDTEDVGQFADAGRLDQNVIGMVGVTYLCKCSLEVALQRAADAAAVDFVDDDAGIFEESSVDADFAEFIFDEDNLFIFEYVFEKFLNQCCFPCSEKT